MRKSLPLIVVLGLAAGLLYWTKQQGSTSSPSSSVKQGATVATGTPKAWPHSQSDIPADQKTIFGALPNGMRYIIYPNTEPPQRLSVRLHIATGSLMEEDDQQGVAHFLEHMVFKGTTDLSADEINRRFDELAMTAPEALRRLGDMGRCGSLDTADIMLAFARGGIVDAIEALRANPNAHLVKAMYETANGLRIEMHDAQAALDKILRVHGAYRDRVEVTTDQVIGFEIVAPPTPAG
jgi:hypothetical protein